MAAEERIKKYYYCDLESERSHSWTNADIFCAENGGKWWRTDGATYTEQTQANGFPLILPSQLGTGTSITTKYLRGDATWQTIAGGGDLLAANNLSDVASASTSRTNLGLDTTANQTDSSNKRFMTDAQETKLDAVVLPTGTPDGTKYLRDDNTWQPVSGGSGLSQAQVLSRASIGFKNKTI